MAVPDATLAVLTQPAKFFGPRRQFEAVAYDADGKKYEGVGPSSEEAYAKLREALAAGGYKGEVRTKGLRDQAEADAYNAQLKPQKKAEEPAHPAKP